MLFNLRGTEIDVALPKSLAEVNLRIEKLVALHQRLQEELKKLPPKSMSRQIKGQAIHQMDVELQILKRWRRNANIRLEKLLANTDVGSGELQTEAGLIKHLYQELRRLNREHCFSIERDSKLANVLSAAQLWLRNYYSTKLSSADLVKDVEPEEDAHLQQHRMKQDKLDREFQERERIRWQEHLLAQQKQRDSGAATQRDTVSRSLRDQTTSAQQQPAEIRKVKAERKRKQQEEALRIQREQEETKAAMQLLTQLSKQGGQ